MAKQYFDPYRAMSEFYRLDNPSEEEQFVFTEAMDCIIRDSEEPADIEAASFNLAMYYRNIKDFQLEKKYLEICEKQGSDICKEPLGLIWYYGYCGDTDYKKAYKLFTECNTRRGLMMIADMYYYGQYVERDFNKCREIIDGLFVDVECERHDERFQISTLFPEISLRFVKLDIEEKENDEFDLDCILAARRILSYRQMHRPFWGNIQTMKEIIDVTDEICQDRGCTDVYNLLSFDVGTGTILFDYDGKNYQIDIFRDFEDTVYQFEGKWYRGPVDFLEKVQINQKRITSLYDQINISQINMKT